MYSCWTKRTLPHLLIDHIDVHTTSSFQLAISVLFPFDSNTPIPLLIFSFEILFHFSSSLRCICASYACNLFCQYLFCFHPTLILSFPIIMILTLCFDILFHFSFSLQMHRCISCLQSVLPISVLFPSRYQFLTPLMLVQPRCLFCTEMKLQGIDRSRATHENATANW